MAEKQKTRNPKRAQTMIVLFAMGGILGLWNMLATVDRHKTRDDSEKFYWVACTPTPGASLELQQPSLKMPTPLPVSRTDCVTRTRSS